MSKRLIKKKRVELARFERDIEWLTDLNAFLLETILDDEPQVELIIKQFKRQLTKGGNRRYFSSITVTRLRSYVKSCLGNAYGRECKR